MNSIDIEDITVEHALRQHHSDVNYHQVDHWTQNHFSSESINELINKEKKSQTNSLLLYIFFLLLIIII